LQPTIKRAAQPIRGVFNIQAMNDTQIRSGDEDLISGSVEPYGLGLPLEGLDLIGQCSGLGVCGFTRRQRQVH
jgi:hypothetical protein